MCNAADSLSGQPRTAGRPNTSAIARKYPHARSAILTSARARATESATRSFVLGCRSHLLDAPDQGAARASVGLSTSRTKAGPRRGANQSGSRRFPRFSMPGAARKSCFVRACRSDEVGRSPPMRWKRAILPKAAYCARLNGPPFLFPVLHFRKRKLRVGTWSGRCGLRTNCAIKPALATHLRRIG